jgi:hypothetical protein
MYCSQQQVEAYLDRPLTDGEALMFQTLETGIEDSIDLYCGRTFSASRSTTYTIDSTIGDGSSNPFQSFDGGVYEIFFDTPLQTDTTKDGIIAPYIGSYDPETAQFTIVDPFTYIFYPVNSKVKTSVATKLGVFPFGFNNVFVYGTYGDYLEVPQGIQLAATTLIGNYYNTSNDLTSETIEGYARTFVKTPNPIVAQILDSYKRILL